MRMERIPVLVSACLLGLACRYDGKGKTYGQLEGLERACVLIPACPEQLGGLATPRPPAERRGCRVETEAGTDVTRCRRSLCPGGGAAQALFLAEKYGCRLALLKEKSPSCGCGRVYDGTFSRTLIPGDGVTAELFRKRGIEVFGESQVEELLRRLEELREREVGR